MTAGQGDLLEWRRWTTPDLELDGGPLADFNRFHAGHPEVFERFEALALRVIRSGRRHYSAATLLHVIRFETDVDTRQVDGFKVNNNWSPYYARLFVGRHPELSHFFEFRTARADALPHRTRAKGSAR